MSVLQKVSLMLVIVGAVNWGIIGFFQFDLVAAIFGGQDAALSRIIYGLVGIAGLLNLSLLFPSKPAAATKTSARTNH